MVIKFRSGAPVGKAGAVGVTVVAAALLLTGCSGGAGNAGGGPAAAPEPEVLSATEAGGIYLDAVCPVNAAWDDVDVELERLRLTVSRGEDDTRRFAAAMEKVAQQSKAAARALDPRVLDKGGHAWPDSALDEIEAVQETLEADEKQATKVSKLDAAEILAYAWQGSTELGTAASEARSVLSLPADGESACAQWAEQAAAEAAAKKAAAEEAAQQAEEDARKQAGSDKQSDSDTPAEKPKVKQ
ncbi:hypothetical protein ACXR2W_09160 [Leucobacter sp. HY1908]